MKAASIRVAAARFAPAAALSLALLLAPRPAAAEIERLVAAQIDVLPGSTWVVAERLLDDLKAMGFNTVILRVFQGKNDHSHNIAGGGALEGVYFATTAPSMPVVDDILSDFAERARKRGLKVFAWMTTRKATYGFAETSPERTPRCFDVDTGRRERSAGLDLFHPGGRGRLRAVMRDLAKYDLDGIVLDEDLKLEEGEPATNEGLLMYYLASGKALSGGELFSPGATSLARYKEPFWPWAEWKAAALLDIAAALRDEVKAASPRCAFGLTFDVDVLLDAKRSRATMGLDLEKAAARAFEYLFLRVSHRKIASALKAEPEEALKKTTELVAAGAATIRNPSRLVAIVLGTDPLLKTDLPMAEIGAALKAVAAAPGPVSLGLLRSPNMEERAALGPLMREALGLPAESGPAVGKPKAVGAPASRRARPPASAPSEGDGAE